MCGVVAALACGEFESPKDEKIRQESIIYLVSELLQLTQVRGKEATGIATLFSDCDFMGLKMGVSAQEFVARFGGNETDFAGYLNIWRKKKKPAKIVIGHCRKPSTGTTATVDDNTNNHPIKVGNIIGVHNGTLINHETIFKNLGCGRDGHVDSEAIFRLLHHFTNNGVEPFTTEGVLETCKRIEGTYACLAFSGNNPYQLTAFRDGRPLEICIIRPLKTMLIASEKDFLKAAIFRYNKMANLYQACFTPLKKDDVELGTLPDDSLFLFDTNEDITKDTKPSDLYVTEKVPRLDKIWKKSVTTVWASHNKNTPPNNANRVAEVNVSKPNVAKTGVANSEDGDTDDDVWNHKEPRVGMAWSRTDYKYIDVNDDGSSYLHKTVEIDVEDGEIVDVHDNVIIEEGKKKPLNQTSSNRDFKHVLDESDVPLDNLVSDPAKIKEIFIVDPKSPVLKDESRTEIDATTYPEVIRRAHEAGQKEGGFVNNTELANAIEAYSVHSLESMELYSLANRVKQVFFRNGWYKGYLACIKDNEKDLITDNNNAILKRALDKIESSKSIIRVLKTMLRIYDRVIKQDLNAWSYDYRINKAVAETVQNGEDVGVKIIDKIFREGDIKNSITLKKIVTTITAGNKPSGSLH